MKIEDFLGNEQVMRDIRTADRQRMLPHAILLDGARGTGKTTLAVLLSQMAVCSSEKERPCGVCSHCRKAGRRIHPDVMIADGNHSGELSVQAVRTIRSQAYIKPNEADCRVFLLLNCDKMLAQAQNAFLKVLEEPPGNALFVLTVTSANMLLETIRSRCRLYSLIPPEVPAAAQELKRLFPDKPPEEVEKAAAVHEGNIGKAAEMIQNGDEKAFALAEEIFRAAGGGNEYELLKLTSQLTSGRAFAAEALDALEELAAQAVKASAGVQVASEAAVQLSRSQTKQRILQLEENVSRAREVLQTNVNLAFFATWLSAVLRIKS